MTASIRLRGLVRRFGPVTALDGLDLDVAPGTSVGLSGPNGSGRTTLLQVAAALIPPTSGTVEIAGVDAGRFPFEARSHAIYVGSDLPGSVGLRVREYLAFISGARSTRTRRLVPVATDAALDRAELPADASVDRLSAGLRKQLALTAALIVSPPILLLDDPFAALDAPARGRFLNWILESRAAGITVLAAVNDTDADNALCEIVVRMLHGRVVSQSSSPGVSPGPQLVRAAGGG